jgi:hypothetical protein
MFESFAEDASLYQGLFVAPLDELSKPGRPMWSKGAQPKQGLEHVRLALTVPSGDDIESRMGGESGLAKVAETTKPEVGDLQ